MSHFSVLVVGPDVDEQLAPYHEFESTGLNDQYVQEIDQTDEARKKFSAHTSTRYKDPDGNLHSPYTPEGNHDPKFWRELTPEENALYGDILYLQDYKSNPDHGGLRLYSGDWHDGKRYRVKAFAWPCEGWSEVDVPNAVFQTFAEFCEDYYVHKIVPFGQVPNTDNGGDGGHKYGYTIVDERGDVVKTVDRTNPNRKWDWHTIGGRWNGFFKLKTGALGIIGKPGLNRMDSDYVPPAADRADVCMKGDIDIDGMRDEAGEKASKRYDEFLEATTGCAPHVSWEQTKERNRTGPGEHGIDFDKARTEYGEQPAVKAVRSANGDVQWFEPDDFLCTREQYIERARKAAFSTFAVVKDSKWYERGEMGWWGAVSDEKDRDEWLNQFSSLVDELPDTTLLTVCDCHI